MRRLVWLELDDDSGIGVEPTTVELYQEAGNRVALMRGAQQGPAAREYSLAITATEDAIMRFNRGMAEERGVRRDYDFEAAERGE